MSDPRRSHRLITFLRAVRPWFLVGVGVFSLAYFLYFLTTIGPRHVSKKNIVEVKAPDNPAAAKLSGEIDALEKQYLTAVAAGAVSQQSIDKLAMALSKQRVLVRMYPNVDPAQTARLTRLDTELGSATAKLKLAEIDRLEKDGQDAMKNDDADLASTRFTEALRLQREVNSSSADSRYKNFVRETVLAQQLSRLEAAPVAKQMKEAVARARAAVAEQRWSDALAAYIEARDIQQRINQDYGRTVYADLSAIDSLDSEIDSLNAAGIAADIDAKEKQGDEAMAKGNSLQAVSLYAAAGTLQMEVNQKFRRSRFVSPDRVESLEVKRQTALSSDDANALAALDKDIAQHLRKRQIILADQKIEEAGKIVDGLFSKFPKSSRLNGDLKLKLAYLSLKKDDLRTLQDNIYDQLLPMPGVSDRLMLKTEVSQSLYVLVMSSNPSRNPGREFPVDSVSWGDANEFCTRLGWLLGMRVRLPTMDEFRIALGDGQPVIWSQVNSDGHSQEIRQGKPNGVGFYNLLGNLAEWTSTDSDDKAFVFGGSYLDTLDKNSKIPSETRSKNDRARHVGFRVLVDQSSP